MTFDFHIQVILVTLSDDFSQLVSNILLFAKEIRSPSGHTQKTLPCSYSADAYDRTNSDDDSDDGNDNYDGNDGHFDDNDDKNVQRDQKPQWPYLENPFLLVLFRPPPPARLCNHFALLCSGGMISNSFISNGFYEFVFKSFKDNFE